MANKIIAVLAVHNEQKFLPYILPSLGRSTDLVVAVLDNCTDESEKLLNVLCNVEKIILKKHRWRNPRAESKYAGIMLAKNLGDYILVSDCDLVLDDYSVKKAERILDTQKVDAVVFAYKQYTLNGGVLCRFKDELLNLFGWLTKRVFKQPVLSGTYLVRADKAGMKDVTSDYESVLPELETVWLPTGFKHLRPRYDCVSQVTMGISRATLKNYNFVKVLVYSVFTLSPLVLAGFLSEKLVCDHVTDY